MLVLQRTIDIVKMTKEEEISPEEIAHAKKIAEGGMVFNELIHGYHHKFNNREATAYKQMESVMDVFYNKTNNMGDPVEQIPLNVQPKNKGDPVKQVPLGTQPNNMGDPVEQIPLDVQPKTNIHPDVCLDTLSRLRC